MRKAITFGGIALLSVAMLTWSIVLPVLGILYLVQLLR